MLLFTVQPWKGNLSPLTLSKSFSNITCGTSGMTSKSAVTA